MNVKLPVIVAGIAISAAGALAEKVSGIVIDTDRSVNCATVKTIVADVTAGCKSDKEKAVAIYDFVVRTVWMPHVFGHPQEMFGKRLRAIREPLKIINVYGSIGCGSQAEIFLTLLNEAGIQGRLLSPGFAHMSNEVKWDGKWHWMDVWLPCYLTDEKGRIYSYDELMADRSLITNAVKARRVSENFMFNPGPDIKGLANAKKHRPHRAGSGVLKCNYVEDLSLRPGESVTWLWDNVGKWYWPGEKYAFPAFKFSTAANCKEAFPYWEPYKKVLSGGPHPWSNVHYRYYSNAVFVAAPPLTRTGLTALGAKLRNVGFGAGGLEPRNSTAAAVEMSFRLPYVIADTEVAGDVELAEGAGVTFEYSIDGGKTWKVAKRVATKGPFKVGLGKPNSRAYPAGTTSGQYGFELRVTVWPGKTGRTVLKDLKIINVTMLNSYSRPWLEVGDNKVTVASSSAKALAGGPLKITWKWLEDWTKPKSFTHTAGKSGATCLIKVGGTKRPKMQSISIACPAS